MKVWIGIQIGFFFLSYFKAHVEQIAACIPFSLTNNKLTKEINNTKTK